MQRKPDPEPLRIRGIDHLPAGVGPALDNLFALAGVYVLRLGDECVYVGQSIDIRQRLKAHRSAGRQFDSVDVTLCDGRAALAIERELIKALEPSGNRVWTRAYTAEVKARHAREAEARAAAKSSLPHPAAQP